MLKTRLRYDVVAKAEERLIVGGKAVSSERAYPKDPR